MVTEKWGCYPEEEKKTPSPKDHNKGLKKLEVTSSLDHQNERSQARERLRKTTNIRPRHQPKTAAAKTPKGGRADIFTILDMKGKAGSSEQLAKGRKIKKEKRSLWGKERHVVPEFCGPSRKKTKKIVSDQKGIRTGGRESRTKKCGSGKLTS